MRAQLPSRALTLVSPWTVAHEAPVCGITQARTKEWVRGSMGRSEIAWMREHPLSPEQRSSGGGIRLCWWPGLRWGRCSPPRLLKGGQGSLFCSLTHPKLLKWYLLPCRASILVNRWSDRFWHTMWLSLETSQHWPRCAVSVIREGFNSEGQATPQGHAGNEQG